MNDVQNTEPQLFEATGPAAILPDALRRRWSARVPLARGADGWSLPYGMMGDVAVVSIDGPLMQRGGWWFDGHDAVVDRCRAALSDVKSRALVLKINSPGGLVAGCFEAVRAIRAAGVAARKPVVAYVDEQACSAAYALACAASKIYTPPTGQLGSIGVISVLYDRTAANAAEGLNVRVIASGAQKADGHPDTPLTDDVVQREQAVVDQLAQRFAGIVAEARGMKPDAVLALEAGCLWGADAVTKGLADGVCTFEECCARATGAAAPTTRMTGLAANTGDRRMEDIITKVAAMCGTTDPNDILGKLAAWKTSHEELAETKTKLAAATAAEAKATAATQREQLVAEALTARKVTPAEAAQIREGKGFLGGLGNDSLKAMIAERGTVAAPSALRQPEALPDPNEVTLTDEEQRQAAKMNIDPKAMLETKRQHLAAR